MDIGWMDDVEARQRPTILGSTILFFFCSSYLVAWNVYFHSQIQTPFAFAIDPTLFQCLNWRIIESKRFWWIHFWMKSFFYTLFVYLIPIWVCMRKRLMCLRICNGIRFTNSCLNKRHRHCHTSKCNKMKNDQTFIAAISQWEELNQKTSNYKRFCFPSTLFSVRNILCVFFFFLFLFESKNKMVTFTQRRYKHEWRHQNTSLVVQITSKRHQFSQVDFIRCN